MLRRARELGPALLVPAAWTAVTAVHVDLMGETGLFIAHLVMSLCLAVFAVTGRPDMQDGLLKIWWTVIAAGLPVTLCGVAGFFLSSAASVLHGISLFGWMLLPAVAFLPTGQRVEAGTWIYFGGVAGCVLGAVVYGGGMAGDVDAAVLGGIGLVGIGQTAGILDAAIRY